jgi:hypothetical protein
VIAVAVDSSAAGLLVEARALLREHRRVKAVARLTSCCRVRVVTVTRWCPVLLGVFAYGCVALTPEGARVSVYRAPLDGPPFQRAMPEGCRLLATKPPISMPELDLEGQKDPFRVEAKRGRCRRSQRSACAVADDAGSTQYGLPERLADHRLSRKLRGLVSRGGRDLRVHA